MNPLPDHFTRTVTRTFDEGAAWLQQLPALLDEIAARWALTLLPTPFSLSYNYVTPARRADGSEVVLKVGVPNDEMWTEIAALRHDDGAGYVRLLATDEARGALLLERLRPGATLAATVAARDDEAATGIAAEVMRRLWRPAPPEHPFPTVARWAAGLDEVETFFGGTTGPFPPLLLDLARGLFADLLPSQAAPVVLHGDLHHENILSAERTPWLAIDPKGVVGEPAYEVGALLRNPIPGFLDVADPRRKLARRVEILAERLGFDRERILGWAVAQAVLSAWWDVDEAGQGGALMIHCAELLASLRA